MTRKKLTKSERSEQANNEAVRVSLDTKAKIKIILDDANKKKRGRKVKPDDLIQILLPLVTEKHIKILRKQSLSNTDRKLYLFDKYKEVNPNATRDEWEGFQMSSDWMRFLKEHGDFEKAV